MEYTIQIDINLSNLINKISKTLNTKELVKFDKFLKRLARKRGYLDSTRQRDIELQYTKLINQRNN